MRSFSHRSALLTLAMLVLALLSVNTLPAQVFDVDATPRSDLTNGDVAYNPVDDEHLIVWETSTGDVVGQIRRSDGTLVRSWLPLLRSSFDSDYAAPRVTFKTGDDLYVVIAHFADFSRPLVSEDIVVAAFDTTGTRKWSRGLRPWFNLGNPDIAADTFEAPDGCCLQAVWEEADGTVVVAQQLDARGNVVGPRRTLGSRVAMNPRVTYSDVKPDQFLVVYQAKDPRPRVAARTVAAFTASVGPDETVANLDENPRTSRGERFAAGVDVAFNTNSDQYVAAWGDNGSIRARRLTTDVDPVGAVLFLAETGETPTVVSLSGGRSRDRRIAVSHARFDLVTLFPVLRFGHFIETTFVDPVATANWRLTTWDDQAFGAAASSFSTVRERLLFTWQQEEDPRGGGFPGYSDLRGQIVNRP